MVTILLKCPTRGRPQKFLSTIRRYLELASGDIPLRILVSADTDDPTMYNAEMAAAVCDLPNAQIVYGPPRTKVEAINANMECAGDWDILVLVSDDMIPEVDNWDRVIAQEMFTHFPMLDGGLWYNDGVTEDRLCTLAIIGRRYYERFGYIYHRDYQFLWCDNEFTEVAQAAGKIVYHPEVLIRHVTPLNGQGGQMDDVYRRSESHSNVDRETFLRRKAAGFP